jgi:ABC-type microcin C transport system permease subunit YejB
LVLTLAKPLPRIRRSAASKIFSFVSTSHRLLLLPVVCMSEQSLISKIVLSKRSFIKEVKKRSVIEQGLRRGSDWDS